MLINIDMSIFMSF